MMSRNLIFFVLASLLLSAAACGKGEAPKEPAPQGGGEFVPGQTDKPASAVVAGDDAFKGAGVALPRSGEVAGYTLTEGPEYFTKDKLFEVMDGASDGYIAYGFLELAKAVYKPAEGKLAEDVNVEIFKFDKKLGALGKFAEERSGCLKTDTLPANMCLRASDVLAWRGDFLLKVQTFDDSPAAEAAITELAQAIEKKLAGDAALPEALGKLPTAHRVQGSEGYKIRDSYGFTGLKELFTASYKPSEDYKEDAEAITLFAVDKGSAAEASKLLGEIKATLEKDASVTEKGGLKALEGVGDQAFAYTDALATHTFGIKGGVVFGGRDFKKDEDAKQLTQTLASGL